MADQHERERDEIARRAYERYEARGRDEGRDQEDWFEAEREMRNQDAQTGGRKPDASSAGMREEGGSNRRGRE